MSNSAPKFAKMVTVPTVAEGRNTIVFAAVAVVVNFLILDYLD